MAKVVEFKVGKGKTLRPSEAEEWTKKYLEFTIRLPEVCPPEVIDKVIVETEMKIDEWLALPEVRLPESLISMEDIEALPWKASPWALKKRRPGDNEPAARPGEDAWMHQDVCDERLKAMIKDAPDGKLDMTPYEFSIGGRDGNLVVRRYKREKAK